MNISTFIDKNRKYVHVGIVVVLFICLLTVALTGGNDPLAGVYRDYTDQGENKELVQLLTDYYEAYADGDIKSLEKVATPISDKEKSYIKMISEYVKSYDIEGVLTKPGLNKNGLLTSVKLGVHYKNLKIVAPGLDFFYIEKRDGKYHINNLYSTFNNQNGELDVDPTIIAMIAAFEQQEDVLMLESEVSQAFSRISLEDKDFNVYFTKTLPEVVTDWAADYKVVAQKKKAEEKQALAEKKKQEKKQAEEVKKTKKEKKPSKSENDKEKQKTASQKHKKQSGVSEKIVYTTSEVNVRNKPSLTAERLGETKENARFTVDKEKNGWSRIRFHGKKAWIKSEFLKAKEEKTKKPSSEKTKKSSSKKSKETKRPAKKQATGKDVSSNTKKKKTDSVVPSTKKDFVYTTELVNVRKSPDQTSNSLGKAQKNMKLTRYRQKGEWSEIDYQGRKAWIKTEFLTTKASEKAKEPAEDSKAKIKVGQQIRLRESINVRKEMKTSAGRLGVAYGGENVTVIKVYKNGWTKVNYKGNEGYIKTELLE